MADVELCDNCMLRQRHTASRSFVWCDIQVAILMTFTEEEQAWLTVQMAFVVRVQPRKASAKNLKMAHQD